MVATTCPFFTGELKSTKSFSMRPETWLPTWTVTMRGDRPRGGDLGVDAPAIHGGRLVVDRRRRVRREEPRPRGSDPAGREDRRDPLRPAPEAAARVSLVGGDRGGREGWGDVGHDTRVRAAWGRPP